MSGRVENRAAKERTRFALLEPNLPNLRLREQRGSFDQAAEFLLAHVMMLTFTREQIFHRLVLDLQPLEMNDAQGNPRPASKLDFAPASPRAIDRAAYSAMRAFTSFRTNAAGKGLSAGKRIVPLLVS